MLISNVPYNAVKNDIHNIHLAQSNSICFIATGLKDNSRSRLRGRVMIVQDSGRTLGAIEHDICQFRL